MAANYHRRLVIVLSTAGFVAIAIIWLVFHPILLQALGRNSIFLIVLGCIGVASIYFCYYTAKRVPGYGLGLSLLAISFAVLSVEIIASSTLKVGQVWTEPIHYLTEALLPVATAVLLWQARKARAKKRTQE